MKANVDSPDCINKQQVSRLKLSEVLVAGVAKQAGNGSVIEVEGEKILTLVPWADSLNHCSTATERSVLQYDHDNDAAVLFAHKDYAEGEEVFDSYGTWLTPSELLLDYGFVAGPSKTNAITVRLSTFPLSQVHTTLV